MQFIFTHYTYASDKLHDCPANGRTKRDDVRDLLNAICRRKPDARELLLSALQNEAQYGLWEKPKD